MKFSELSLNANARPQKSTGKGPFFKHGKKARRRAPSLKSCYVARQPSYWSGPGRGRSGGQVACFQRRSWDGIAWAVLAFGSSNVSGVGA